MKVLIVGYANIYSMPYLWTYVDLLKKSDVSFDVISWNREELDKPDYPFQVHYYNSPLSPAAPAWKKLKGFIGYGFFIRRQLDQEQYDRIIVLSQLLSAFIGPILPRRFKGKYIIDYRDYGHDSNFFIKRRLHFIYQHASEVVVSSKYFREFIDREDCLLCHNSSQISGRMNDLNFYSNRNEPIQIAYVGAVQYYDQNIQFITLIKNDSRFQYHIWGDGADLERIKVYILENCATNVFVHGRYDNSIKNKIYQNVDIIFNVYGNSTINLRSAVSNKFYDAAAYCKPVLVSEGTAMEKELGALAITINSQTTADELFNTFQSLDREALHEQAKHILAQVDKDMKVFEDRMKQILLEK